MLFLFCELRPMDTRKVVVLGAVVLPTSLIVAFAVGLRECLTVGEFFLIDDVMHREAFELTVVAFCSGVFLVPWVSRFSITVKSPSLPGSG